MLRVGLTGGIGSGKSTVASIFEILGIPVYYADAAAKRLMNEDAALQQQIIQHFGPGSYNNNVLNRPFLSALVFNDQEKLALLNSLVHPATFADADKWMAEQLAPYIIKEAALLFESGSHKDLDLVIGVSAPYELRLKRAMERDKLTEEQVKARMAQQLDDAEKMKRCDVVIYNDEKQMLLPQVLELHEQLTRPERPL